MYNAPTMSELLSFAPHEDNGGNMETTESVEQALNAEQTLLYAMEQAGIIRPTDEMAKPIDRILSEASLPAAEDSEFIIRRDDKALEDFRADETDRNQVQQRITRLINELGTYDDDQRRALRN